ncbi:N-acetylmuramoyl-L-alanine amidase (plasmid) [Salimicrobium jeotgali]|uniref:N-acetylmuramoyl-L-alanine amidase n=1 Tax=Salimicrobium jeotgali TaxID=1230341 RepID=K2FIA4_9BACI|nr:N-acetylmuramoyl-L-alanine amidase [Salimicrobium jeotgali]AKG03400.1 N-acetylmuramoyl-L-alanine amidase [Salimicrobium jeotgali]AKG05824.1 N-acetylmuramoyl-L-alanine amidase [Salimicrobium jeotgali]EKE30816.1 N-acetylmuramoyl-L-alanine amidase [Salimicrobium jeotgali]MBM7697695.1 N-acetylmuramoyl-L-alanine amidase [Salimicrobium jeotgali]
MIIEDFIPKANTNRPGNPIRPSHITVHETANTDVGANAQMHANYLKSEEAQEREVSWHYTVDDSKTYQHLLEDEIGWHAGSEGNKKSIGVELCVNNDGDFFKTRNRGIKLIRLLMRKWDIPLSRVVPHYYWTGKDCPAQLLNEWSIFKDQIADRSEGPSIVDKPMLEVITEELWVYDEPDWQSKYEVVQEGEIFTIVSELTVNGSTMYQLKSGLYITGNRDFVKRIS